MDALEHENQETPENQENPVTEPHTKGKKKVKKVVKKKKKVHKKESSSIPNNNNILDSILSQEEPKPGEQWTDNLFPPTESSLIGDPISHDDLFESSHKNIDPEEIEWKRASEIFPEPYLFENKIRLDSVIPGKVGNVYFLSALAALSQYPGIIRKIFLTQEYNPDGFYKLQLFLDGEYRTIYIDDFFPCLKGTNIPYFSKSNNFELWALLLEKAWAKVNGGYGNCISGWPGDVFRCFTGNACEEINHDDEENEEKIFYKIKNFYDNHSVICVTSRGGDSKNEELINIGLIPNHTYIVIDVEEITNDKNRKVHLYKIKNPLGEIHWEGAWCPKSIFWNDHIRKQIKKDKLELGLGEFFINAEDFVKYFCRTDCCHLMFNNYIFTKDFAFNKNEPNNFPQVFNFFLYEKGKVSVSLIEKNWQFNRELRNKSHPTSLIIAQYEPGLKTTKKCFSSFECFNNCEKCRTLDSGFYIVWCYKNIKESEEPLPEQMKVRILSEPKINIKHLGDDKDFQIIQQIILNGVRFIKGNEIKGLEIFDNISQDFRRSGLGYRLIINPLNDIYLKVEYGINQMDGYTLLPTYQKNEENTYIYQIGPENFGIIIGMKNKKYGKFTFALQSNEEQFKCKEGDDKKFSVERPPFETFCPGDIINEQPLTTKDTQSIPLDTAINDTNNDKGDNADIDHALIFAVKYKELTPLIEEELIKLKPKNTQRKLGWIKLDKTNGIYLGEAEYTTPHGRGCFIFNDENMIWVGYFEDGIKGEYGKLFDKAGNIIYEGEYKNGIKNGKGVYYYEDGKKYDGEFVDDKREGKGTFCWEDGTKWEGNFKNDEMDGEGIFYENEDRFPVTYENGKLID